MAARTSRSSSDDSHLEHVRKRVCKACDRCRLKKSKCDEAKPCSRCRSDNAICVFGERKRAHAKVYPQGYAEKLEQQQVWLVHALQELYRCITEGEGWPGDLLTAKSSGHPAIHDLLKRLGALDHPIGQRFEENTELMQKNLWRQEKQCHELCDNSFEGTQLPVVHPQFTSDTSPQQKGSPSLFKQSHMPVTTQQPISSLQSGVNTDTPQCESIRWEASNSNPSNVLDEMDMIATPDYSDLVFDERLPPSMFNCQMLMDCIMPNEYEDLLLFAGSDPTEITSI
ncbi:hypothetical protein N7494_004532 [Penicillium frequentans]|uniref:Zn(2)-C6 fungal-type domain-containing protein n=1 Tax=Penicillium frequentans TaxID=3151616 RepID=A0AAD6D118_9EURO|nr:hypothetical protein N7494_004532 [Penicillium glabrum]